MRELRETALREVSSRWRYGKSQGCLNCSLLHSWSRYQSYTNKVPTGIESCRESESSLVFDKFFSAANASEDKDVIVKFLEAIKIQLESAPTKPHKPAKSFTLEDAVDYFSLTYGFEYPDSIRFHWNIEKLPDVQEMQPSACLCSVFCLIFLCRIDVVLSASFLTD